MTNNRPIDDGDGGGGGGSDAIDTSSSSSAAEDSCVEPKIVSDGEPRSNGSSPPSSTTIGSFELVDDAEKAPPSISLNQLDANEKLLALAASVAARTSTSAVSSSTSTDTGTRPKSVPHPTRVTSYSSLEGALMGSASMTVKPKIDEVKPPEPPRVRVSRQSPVKSRSTVPRQKGTYSGLRRGKWTVEEEVYVVRVIQDFNSGFLDAPAGTTLRTYLSEKLKCDPMRITKKFTGESCIGKRVFHPAVRTAANGEAIDKAQAELNELELRWRRRLEMQQRESAKKAAASAAVAQVAAVSTTEPHNPASSSDRHVAQTASWLDRAKVALEVQGDENDKTAPADLQTRMQEMQRLIREGPVIQQASADLPHILDDAATERSKRMRTTEEGDAEALVGFLRTVRAAVDSSSSTVRAPPTTD